MLAALSGLAVAVGVIAAISLLAVEAPPLAPATRGIGTLVGLTPRRAAAPKVDYKHLEGRIARLMQEPTMVGLAVGTIEDGQVTFAKGYGETRAGGDRPVTPDTVFRWASLSKSVASALVVGLADEGKLSLDTPLTKLGTTLTVPGDARRVTTADILSHRVGLVRNAWDDRLEAGEDPRLIRAALGTLPAFCAPGTCYAYQNVAFDTATEIIEKATGHDYANVALTRLFVPLGMTNSSIGRAGLQGAGSWAQPHHGRTPVTVTDIYYRVPAAGGVNSSIRDLLRWMGAQMGEAPAVLSPADLDLMHRPRVSTPPHGRRGPMDRALAGPAYGLGWRTYNYAGHALVGHRGSVDGYGSLILFDPALKSGIVMLWNSNHHQAARLQLEFFDLLYGLPPTDWLDLSAPPPVLTDAAPAGVTRRGDAP